MPMGRRINPDRPQDLQSISVTGYLTKDGQVMDIAGNFGLKVLCTLAGYTAGINRRILNSYVFLKCSKS